MKILANDGIAQEGKKILQEAGFEVITDKIPQDELASKINNYDVLIVRSATRVTADIIQASDNIKLIVRAGVGVDNIDIAAAKAKGIEVANTPLSSSLSVAELVFSHIFSLLRFVHRSGRELNGETQNFNQLKKDYSNGLELRGKTMGIIGFGRIGQETAKIALSLGMKVIYHDPYLPSVKLRLEHIPVTPTPIVEISSDSIEKLFAECDILSFHVPFNKGMTPLINANSVKTLKKGVCLINCARGGVIDESVLSQALKEGIVGYAGLDVFEEEPSIRAEWIHHPNVSITPHIGASTKEAQDRIALEVAEVIINKLKVKA